MGSTLKVCYFYLNFGNCFVKNGVKVGLASGNSLWIDWLFTVLRLIAITGKWQQNLGLCAALRAFEEGGICIMPHLLGPLFFRSRPRTTPFSRLLRHTRGCGEHILIQILMGTFSGSCIETMYEITWQSKFYFKAIPQNQLPCLQVDGRYIPQSGAILRYVGRTFGKFYMYE
jgi:hypothetical protein